jgi:TetR/AcrR family transcriptional repressor of nem operon
MKTIAQTKTSPTRDKLLDAALGLMLENGFSATGVEDVCRAAKVTKGSFFHYFKTKEDLGKSVLDRFYRTMQAVASQSPHFQKKDPLERVLGWMDFASERSRDPMATKGCLLGTFAQELAQTHEGIRKECELKFCEWSGNIKKDLDAAVALHRPKAPIDTSSLAGHLVASLEGAIVLSKARGDGRPIRETMQHLKAYVSSLFGR